MIRYTHVFGFFHYQPARSVSVRWLDGKAVFGSVAYANSQIDLESKVTERLRAAGDVLVQEFVSGLGMGFSCFIAHGEVFLPFQWQRVREVDPRGSASSCRRSISLDAEMVSLSGRLIAQIGFEGIAMVEYKKTTDDRMILMEINGRPWGSIGCPWRAESTTRVISSNGACKESSRRQTFPIGRTSPAAASSGS